MDTIVIDRCFKPPGLIERAKTYRLQLGPKGLYVLCLGNATQPDVRSDNAIANALAGAVINQIANRYEVGIRKTEDTITSQGPDVLLNTKGNVCIAPGTLQLFSIQQTGNGFIQLKLKAPGINRRFLIHPYFNSHLQRIQQAMGV